MLPTEPKERAEPTEPTEAKDPTDPMDSTEFFELMLRSEPVELIDHRELPSDGTMVASLSGPVSPRRYLVTTAFPAGSTTYQRPPALVNA